MINSTNQTQNRYFADKKFRKIQKNVKIHSSETIVIQKYLFYFIQSIRIQFKNFSSTFAIILAQQTRLKLCNKLAWKKKFQNKNTQTQWPCLFNGKRIIKCVFGQRMLTHDFSLCQRQCLCRRCFFGRVQSEMFKKNSFNYFLNLTVAKVFFFIKSLEAAT